MDSARKSGTALWLRLLAVVVLALAAWMLFKLVIGVLTTVAWGLATVIALVGIAWAVRVLRR